MKDLECMEQLVASFAMLKGVGKKTAQRYAYAILEMSLEDVENFAKNLVSVKRNVHYCKICGNFTDSDICTICQSRKSDTICVVKEPKDVVAIEKTKGYQGLYHVLHGTISPLDHKGPEDIRIKELIQRLDGSIKEVILATNPDIEGEVTANYIAKLIKPLGVKVTRIAQGIQMGSELEYTDEATLSKAIEDRKQC